MENFTLFNLLKALGGMGAADTGGEAVDGDAEQPRAGGAGTFNAGHAEAGGARQNGCTPRGENAPPPPRDGQTNVLAAVLERHEKIANRIRRPPSGGQ